MSTSSAKKPIPSSRENHSRRSSISAAALKRDGKQDIAQIKENVLAVNFGQFKSQVLSYLEPDLQPHFNSEETWDAMRWRIIEALGEELP